MKGNTGLVVLLIAVVIVGLILVSGFGSAMLGIIIPPSSCEQTPYDERCFCPEGDRKIYVPWIGIPRWSCETIEDLIIDPESPTFESDAIQFVKDYLAFYCGDVCTDLECGQECTGSGFEDLCIAAVFGYDIAGNRMVNVECVKITSRDSAGRPASGTIPWRMEFFVESETGMPKARDIDAASNYCIDPDVTERCEPEIELVPTGFSIFPLAIKTSGFRAPL